MFLPTYSITNLILDYIIKYEISIKALASSPLPYKHKQELYIRQKAEEIQSLGELIGNNIGYNKALQIQLGKELPSDRSKYRVFSNFRSAQDFVRTYNRSQFIPPSMALMLHFNKLALSGISDEWEAGKLKAFSEKPNEIYDTWYKYRDFYPELDNVKHFGEIMDWIVSPKVKIHKLIQFSIYLFEMIDKAPFFSLNQITTILTLSALNKDYGYNPDNLLPTAKAVNYLGSDFLEAFKLAKGKKDLTVFIEAFLYSMSIEMLSLQNQVESIFESKVKKQAQLSTQFNNRQIKLLDYLSIHKKITRNEFAKNMGISFMTAYRDLTELYDKGYLNQGGVGRGTYYTLKEQNLDENLPDLPVFIDSTVF